MATQTDVQRLIQNLTPSGVNNGNPNTVYNTPVPMADGRGNWAMPNVNPAASLPALNLSAINSQLGTWQAPTGASPIRGPILPQMPPLDPPGTGGGTPPPGGGTPPPPPVEPPTGTPDGGGGNPPYWLNPDGTIGGRPPATVGPIGTWGRPIYGPGIINNGGGSGGGSSGGGGFPWQQLLDALIPGDAYLENSGEWDASNALLGLADAYQPGLGWLGERGLEYAAPDQYFDHLMDIAGDKMQGNVNEVNDNTNQAVQDNINKVLEEMYGNSTQQPSSRGGRQSAGATTIAEGEAAQGMVGDMQLKIFLNKLAQQARAAMNPRYKYER